MTLEDFKNKNFKSCAIKPNDWVYLCPMLSYNNINWEYWSVLSDVSDCDLIILKDSKYVANANKLNKPFWLISEDICGLKLLENDALIKDLYEEVNCYGNNKPWGNYNNVVLQQENSACFWLEVLISIIDDSIDKRSSRLKIFSVFYIYYDYIKARANILKRASYLWLALLKLRKTHTLAQLALWNILSILNMEDNYGAFKDVLYRAVATNNNNMA